MSNTDTPTRPVKRHPLYASYRQMIYRCTNPRHQRYADYGGRGITVCQRWIDDFWTFVDDMGERPEGLSLDRINNNGPYTPSNCRWATRSQQGLNRRGGGWPRLIGIGHPLAKLTIADRRQIMFDYWLAGIGATKLAKFYGVSRGRVHNIVNEDGWRYAA